MIPSAAAVVLGGGACRSPDQPAQVQVQAEPARNQPRLAFESPLVALKPELGQERSEEVRLAGPRRGEARLAVEKVDPPAEDPAQNPVIEARVLPARDGVPEGLRLTAKGSRVGTGTGRVTVSTGIDDPKELSLLYSWTVKGNLEVNPSNPYFNLRDPGAKERLLKVTSTRADFRLLGARVSQGPFAATVERDGTNRGYSVRVRVVERDVPADTRGFLGKVVLVSNDPFEPAKEVPLFAMGKLNRTGPDPDPDH